VKSHGHDSSDVEGEHNEWKFRAPYLIHENLENDGEGSGGEEGSGNEEGVEKNENGKRVREGGEKFKVWYEGSCHCGRVRYQLGRERPLASKICHCGTCQVLHGSMFQWAAIFEKEDINFVRGHHDLGWYESEEKTTRHKLPCKVSCAYCRSPIMDEGKNMILLFPSLIKFKSEEEKKKFEPQCHIFYSRRLVDIPDGKPKWDGLDKKSELLDED